MRLRTLALLISLAGCARTGPFDSREDQPSTSSTGASTSASVGGSTGQPGTIGTSGRSNASATNGSSGTGGPGGTSTGSSTGSTGLTGSTSSSGSTGTSGIVHRCEPALTIRMEEPVSIALVGSTVWTSGAANYLMQVHDKQTGALLRTAETGLGHADTIVFDGLNVWTALTGPSFGQGILTARRADVYEFPRTTSPIDFVRAMVSDGNSLWIGGDRTLTRFDKQTGLATGSFPAPHLSGQAMAFDGTYLWLTNSAGTVSRFLASDGSLQGTFPAGMEGLWPRSMVFDGTDLWLTNQGDPISGSGKLLRISVATGAVLATFPLPERPNSITFDGTDLFVSHLSGWTQIERTSGATVASCDMAPSVIRQVIADGDALWVTSPDGLYRY